MDILPLHHTENTFSFEDAIRLHNIPTITGQDSISDIERNLSIQLLSVDRRKICGSLHGY